MSLDSVSTVFSVQREKRPNTIYISLVFVNIGYEIQYNAEFLIIFVRSGKLLDILCLFPSVVSIASYDVMGNSEELMVPHTT